MSIQSILKNRRLELGLTLLDVAKQVGVSEGTVSRWESGDIANMRRDRIMALAAALDLSPAVIMGWDQEHNKSTHIEKPTTSGELSEDAAAIARRIMALPAEKRKQMEDYLAFLLSQQRGQ